MKIKKGTKLLISSKRKGNYEAIALEDFDTEKDEWYPITPSHTVQGLCNCWSPGERIPCRKSLCAVKVKTDQT